MPPVIARLPGGVVVAAAGTCLQVRTGRPTRDPADCVFPFQSVLVAVPCAARRTVVVARLRGRVRRLEVVTDRGVVRGRRPTGAYAVAIVPARSRVRGVRLVGAGSAQVDLPPASRQCGYEQPLEPS